MRPISPSHDETYQAAGDAVRVRECFLCVRSRSVIGANLANLLFSQFSHAVCAALVFFFVSLNCHPAFAVAVDSVIASGPQKQVVRTHAGTIIASVQDAHSLGECAKVQLERKTMHRELPASGNAHPAISGMMSIACPVPAGFSFRDVAPKTLYRIHGVKVYAATGCGSSVN